jgi:starch synthase
MKVLYIAAECKPFSKTGGVGDVAGELPLALRSQGVDIEIVTPWYGRTAIVDARLSFQGRSEDVGLVRTDLQGIPVNFIKNPTHFEFDYSEGKNRPKFPEDQPPFKTDHLYRKDYSTPYVESDSSMPFIDDALRFSFFSRACLDLIERKKPDIVHANDWVLGYLFGWMAMKGMRSRRVLTIHNIGYQGNIGRDLIRGWQIEDLAGDRTLGPLFTDPRPAWRSVNALRLAMELADAVNTVSPTYKKEMTQPEDQNRYFEGGKGLDEVAARLDGQRKLHGILNGFGYKFAPDRGHLEKTLAAKAEMKAELSQRFPNPGGLLFGFVGRAVEQKFKLLAEKIGNKSVLDHLLEIEGVNMAIVATGQKEYERILEGLRGRPNVDITIAFDPVKARQISLGSDVFLMPSVFEPCGITQMESMSVATPPLVRWTGGLVDTVRRHTPSAPGTGFGFDGSSRQEVLENLVKAARQAVDLYTNHPAEFRKMQEGGFRERFSWVDAARAYIQQVYEPTCAAQAR